MRYKQQNKRTREERRLGVSSRRSLYIALAAFAGVAALGVYTLRSSFAAVHTVAVEAETGTRAGNAVAGPTAGASGSASVKFGSAPAGGGNPLQPGGGIIPAGVRLLHDGSIGPAGYRAQWTPDQGRVEDASDGPGHEHVMKAISSGRSEVIAPNTLWSFNKPRGAGPIREGTQWWMAFSVKFTQTPPSSSFALVWQVHAGYPFPDGSPPVAMNFTPSTFKIGNNRAHLNDGGWSRDIGPLPVGQWKDYVVYIKFSESGSTGRVKVWENGQPKVDTAGQTLASGGSGNSFFKYGAYGGSGTTVLHDNMKIYVP